MRIKNSSLFFLLPPGSLGIPFPTSLCFAASDSRLWPSGTCSRALGKLKCLEVPVSLWGSPQPVTGGRGQNPSPLPFQGVIPAAVPYGVRLRLGLCQGRAHRTGQHQALIDLANEHASHFLIQTVYCSHTMKRRVSQRCQLPRSLSYKPEKSAPIQEAR